jgi:hypothetical protein
LYGVVGLCLMRYTFVKCSIAEFKKQVPLTLTSFNGQPKWMIMFSNRKLAVTFASFFLKA